MANPIERLRYHVTGAIERGEKEAIVARETMPTKVNTRFMDWWPLLNSELAKQGWPQAGYGDARGCYDIGDSPETGAAQLIAVWS